MSTRHGRAHVPRFGRGGVPLHALASLLPHTRVRPRTTTPTYWDNACSLSLVNDPSLLYGLQPLPLTLSIDGIAGAAQATHYGYLHCLPPVNRMNMALYSPHSTTNLLSLGHIQRTGGHYQTTSSTTASIRLSPHVPALPVTLNPSNLYPVDYHRLTRTTLALSSKPHPTSTPSPPYRPPLQAFTSPITHRHPTRLPIPTLLRHADRKLSLTKAACLRDRIHRHAHPSPYTNKPTTIRPHPAPIQRSEFTLNSAPSALSLHHTKLGIAAELDKVFDKYHALTLTHPRDIAPNGVFLPALWVVKPKPTTTNPNRIKARLAVNGARQPPHTYSATHAGTSDAQHRIFIIATALADCSHRGTLPQLRIGGFDLESAFINGLPLPLTATGGCPLYTRLPTSPLLPPRYSNALATLTGPMNGIKQANHLFDQDLIHQFESRGYTRCPSSPYSFTKRCPHNPLNYLTVSMNVDDGEYVSTSDTLLEELQSFIRHRWGPHTQFIEPSPGMCGIRMTHHSNRDISMDYGPYIRKVLRRIGMHTIPPALTPSLAHFFDPPTDPTPASPTAHTEFQRINGELIFIIPLRHDCRMEINHLCSANGAPTQSDLDKQFQLLRYLHGCPDIGPTFSANPLDHPRGVEIHSASDSSHNTHPTSGRSHSAFLITIGQPGANTSPFMAHSSSDSTGISLSPMESEYVCISLTAKSVSHYRQFAEDLGFPQHHPTIMLEDNSATIKLCSTPIIPFKSRHIALKHHHIRDLTRRKIVLPTHQGTHDIVPDAMTKTTPPSRFLYNRFKLFPRVHSQLSTSPKPSVVY